MSTIQCTTTVSQIHDCTLIHLPLSASQKLPSRGMTLVKGMINGTPFQTVLEPDGKGSHWFPIDHTDADFKSLRFGDKVTLTMETSKEWPEPTVPNDIVDAVEQDARTYAVWKDITPMARWDWIRWIRSTKYPETRKKRIQITLSKLRSGMRRPCCFNRSMCTDPSVSHNGVLLDLEK